jgi:DNA-binding transcriptional LysR family regulator
MDLNALTDFALVATNGGLGKASRASGRSKATLSRRVAELEEQLGVRLIERSARGLKLTEAGQLLIDRTEGPMHEVADAMTSAREGLSVPRGRLRIASPVLFSQLAMGRICAEFCAAYPDVTCEVVAEDRLVDLVEEQFDAAIRINPGPDSMIRDAAVAGAGAALMPQSIAWNQLTRGELVQWGMVSGVEVALWVLHTSRRLPAPKVRAFVEFMCEQYPQGSLVLNG